MIDFMVGDNGIEPFVWAKVVWRLVDLLDETSVIKYSSPGALVIEGNNRIAKLRQVRAETARTSYLIVPVDSESVGDATSRQVRVMFVCSNGSCSLLP